MDYMLQQQVKGEKSVTMIEGFRVTDVIMEADTVIGVKGQDRTNNKQEYHASIVVGADGRHSLIRKLVHSQLKISSPTTVAVYFGYFTGFSHDVVPKFEVYKRKDKTVILFPTNDDAYAVVVNFPLKDKRLVADFKKNPEKSLRKILTKQFPNTSIGARIMPARLAEPMKGILGYENYWYQGMGKGWALVGDAICFKDPGMAQGIHDAIRGAQILADILKKKEWLQNQWDKTVMEYQQLIEDEFMARFYMGCEMSKNKLVTEQQDAVDKINSAPILL